MSEYFSIFDVTKKYSSRNSSVEVLDGINLKVREHEFVCIMGSTGCGKSTLLQILGGIEKPDAGQIFFHSKQLPAGVTNEIKKNFGYVFQSDCLLEWRTLEQNVRMPLEIYKLNKQAEYQKRIDEMLELVGLQEYKNCYPKELSGGMKQRGAIARALVHNPEVLLLDHPFGALDAITRKMLGYELLKIWNETKKTVIMITNNVEEALLLANRIVFMSDKPSRIVKEVTVPFSFEERDENIILNETYLQMREELNQFIKGKGVA